MLVIRDYVPAHEIYSTEEYWHVELYVAKQLFIALSRKIRNPELNLLEHESLTAVMNKMLGMKNIKRFDRMISYRLGHSHVVHIRPQTQRISVPVSAKISL